MPNLLHISVRLSGPYCLKSLGKGTATTIYFYHRNFLSCQNYRYMRIMVNMLCRLYRPRALVVTQKEGSFTIIIQDNCSRPYAFVGTNIYYFLVFSDQKCQISFRIFIQAHKFCATTSIVDSSLHPIQVPTYVLHTYIVSPSGFFQEAV